MCLGDPEIKKCAGCSGTGKKTVYQAVEEYGNDIVYGSAKPADKKEKKYKPTLAAKTPRVATVEAKHIYRAYVDNLKYAKDRIEEYGRLSRGVINSLIVGYEPEDNPRTGEGRKYDYGRSMFTDIPSTQKHNI
jgi:hypothetical protein